MRESGTRKKGFTFVEILAAMVFMAIVIPITVQGILVANRMGVVAERTRIATQLAETQLAEIVLSGDWQGGNQNGNFGEAYPEYSWTMQTESWSEDAMLLVSIEVLFKVQERDYSVVLSTLVDEEEATGTTGSGATSSSGSGGTSSGGSQ